MSTDSREKFDARREQERKERLEKLSKEKGYIIKDGLRPRIDYLKIIDNIIGGIYEK